MVDLAVFTSDVLGVAASYTDPQAFLAYWRRAFLEVVFCEITPWGVCGNIFLQYLLWEWLTCWSTKPRGSWLKRMYWRLIDSDPKRRKLVDENYVGEPFVEMLDIEHQPSLNWIIDFATCLHHGLGGGVMLLGWWYDMPWLWRHGILTEVGGLDLKDLVKVTNAYWYYYVSPGLRTNPPWPLDLYVKQP